ncbi:hypothetical protein MLD52_18520 [Puniceicoccaceae bacterium K14]|nr:hypothetical protein [Puniceicoccaceae bacterium K14]
MIRTSTRLQYANGYLDLSMIKEAKLELEAIVDEDKNDLDVLRMWNRFHLVSENWFQLEVTAHTLTEKRPQDPFGWVNWAYALRELDKIQAAKNVASEALTRHPKEAVLWYNLACYCCLLGELKDAKSHLEKTYKLDSNFKEEAAEDPDLQALRNSDKTELF